MKEIIKVFAVCFGAGACAGAGCGMIDDIRNRRKTKKLKEAMNKLLSDLEELAEKEKTE